MGLFSKKPNIESMIKDKDIEGLILALDHKNGTVRFYAGQCLGHLGDSKAVEPLINALSDKDLGVRSGAVTALRNIKDPRAIKPLQQILNEENEDSLIFSVKEALAKIEGKDFYITFSKKNPDS